MKNYIKSIMTAALLLVATGTWADNVTVTTQVDGQASTAGGTATVDRPDALGGEEVTITVKPEQGYYLEDITAIKTIAGTYAQTRAPGIDEPLTLTHASGDAIEGQTTYKFVMPETGVNGASYSVEVTVNFSQRTSITDDATVTATGTFTYSGKAIVPETITVKLVSSNTTLTKATDYTLAFADNTNQGTATITATGVGKYAGTATGTFTINPKEVKNPVIKLSQTSFDYDGQEHMPTVTVYDVDGTTEIPASEYNVAYQKKTSDSGSTGSGETGTSTSGTGTSTDAGNVDGSGTSVVTKEEGTYTVVVTDKKGGNYTIATATADYEIKASSLYAADGIWIWTDNVTIVAQSKEKTYDGTSLDGHDTAFARGIPEGFSVSITASGLQTDAGESDIKIESFIIYNSRNEDVTSHFTNITTEIGKLIITPAPLTVQTGSASKTYDGTPLTNPEAYVTGLVNEETATVTATGSQTDAGESENTFEIKWDSAKKSNYIIIEDLGTLTVETKEVKNPTIKLSPTSFKYDGQEHKPTVTVYDGTTEIPASEYNVRYQKKASDSGNSGSGETGTSAIGTGTSTEISSADGSSASVETKETGTYIVTISDKMGGNYKISNATAEFEITPKQTIWLMIQEVNPKTFTYDGNPHSPQLRIGAATEKNCSAKFVLPDTEYTIEYKYNNTKVEECIAPGAYTMVVMPKAGSQYTFDPTTAEFEILESDPAVTAPTPIENLVYNGNNQQLFNPGSTTGGTMKYSIDRVTYPNGTVKVLTGYNVYSTFSKFTHSLKDAGTYLIYYKVEGNEYYNDVAAKSFTVTISQKEVKNPTINLSETSFNYDGQEHKPTVTVYDDLTKIPESEYNVSYQKKASDSGSTGSGEIKEPGTYIVTITDKEGGNYTLGTATAEFKIVEDENTDVVVPPTPIEGLVYNGQPQALVKAGSVSKLREMQYRLSSENAWSTEIPVATNAGEYEVEYWAQAINALAKDLTSGYVKVTIAPKELKEENFFIGSSKDRITNASLNPYPVVDSVTVVLIEGDQPIKLQEGTDYTFDYFGADNQWIAEDELYMDKNQNKSINLVVTGKGNYSGEVSRSFTNTPVFYSINEQTNTATITGLANSEATTVVIPSTVAANGRNYPVTSLKDLGIEFPGTRLIDLTDFNLKNLKENPLEIEGGALEGKKVKVLPETLAFFASNPSLRTNVENGQLYADLKADYYLQTFSCGIDITIPGEKKITYVVGKDTVNLGTIRDITEYLKFYKCTVKENDGKDEVFVSSIHDQMKDGFRRKTSGGGSGGGSTVLATSLLYEANNGVLIACDTTSVINLIEQVDVASIADQVDLKSLATALGYGALVKYAPEAMLKQYVLDNADLIKKKIKEQFRSTAATLVAQYTKDKPIATGDVKTYGLDNMLVPVTESSHFDATDEAGNTYYILYNGTFHKINDNIKTEVSACKAVLKVPGSMAKSRTLDITEGDDDATVISAILAEGDGGARWYNLSGQRIEKPTKKGLYILNGHKVVIK
jgi:hypothetical protein